MKYPVYAIRDIAAGFGMPRIELNELTAKRNFAFEINRENSILAYSPKDYDLYKIGSYDTDSGKFDSIIPEFVLAGTSAFGEVDKND